MPKLKEFIELDEIDEIQKQIRSINYELLNTLNETNVVRELMVEKGNAIRRASDVSEMLIPEIRALNHFLIGDEFEDIKPLSRPVAKQVMKHKPSMPKEIISAKPTSKGRGRPRKTETKVVAKTKKVPSYDNNLDDLKANLAKLRADLRELQ